MDIDYISKLSGLDEEEVIDELGDSIYQDPLLCGNNLYKGWVRAEEYLSGNIREKLSDAKWAARRYPGIFDRNIAALEKVLPVSIAPDDIYITLGSPWVPVEVIRDYLRNSINSLTSSHYSIIKHDSITGSWEIRVCNTAPGWDFAFNRKFGTNRIDALEIFKRTLNKRPITIMDEEIASDGSGKMRKILNTEETAYALEKQKEMIADFREWVWLSEKRKKLLTTIYNETYGFIRTRQYDGSFLSFPGMSDKIQLYKYQKDAVARILFSKNTLLAHEVGTGKTFIMIAAGMELRRLKLRNRREKIMYTVPNSIVGQWANMFKELYPVAKVVTVTPADFTPKKRHETLTRIRNEDYDAVIMAHSCFSQIELSKLALREHTEKEIRRFTQEMQSMRSCSTAALLSQIRKLENTRAELCKSYHKDPNEIFFEDLGITRLFVDEVHYFKNVPIKTSHSNVKGINATGSNKCKHMMDKVQFIQSKNDGGGVVFATGTPITNSITDAFVMQKYLQEELLQQKWIESFDGWTSMFAELDSGFEIDVDTNKYRITERFSKFHNIPELTTLLSEATDYHENDNTSEIPEHDGYIDVLVPKTTEFNEFLSQISTRADMIRNKEVSRVDDNMLKLTTDGRKAALDLRLIDSEKYHFTPVSKVYICAEKISQIYMDTETRKSTQLVFCDISVPGMGFNIYTELKRILLDRGVKESDVAFVHDAKTERKRDELFKKVREGEIRILIGSTFKLGVGVNVQDRLIALHHLDIPWRPADMVQREGRILRQGNSNPKVELYRYITEGSFDAYSWQLLETKQRFITEILSGLAKERSGADVDDTVLNYAEVKALAIGNQLVKTRVEISNELTKYRILQKKALIKRLENDELNNELPKKLEEYKSRIEQLNEDSIFYEENKFKHSPESRRNIARQIYSCLNSDEPIAEDKHICEYQGFTIIVPQGAFMSNPIIRMYHQKGRYFLKLGNDPTRYVNKIDRLLDGLKMELQKVQQQYNTVVEKLRLLSKEREDDDETYLVRIKELENELNYVDKQLGIAVGN